MPGHFPQGPQLRSNHAAAAFAGFEDELAPASNASSALRFRARQRRVAALPPFCVASSDAMASLNASSANGAAVAGIVAGALSTERHFDVSGSCCVSQSRSTSHSYAEEPTPPLRGQAYSPRPSLKRPPKLSHYAGNEAGCNLNLVCGVSSPPLRGGRGDDTTARVMAAGEAVQSANEPPSALISESDRQRPDHQGQRDPVGVRRRHMAAVARHHITARTA